MFTELGTVPQITILVHTDLEPRAYFTNPLANYENPKQIAVWGTATPRTVRRRLDSAVGHDCLGGTPCRFAAAAAAAAAASGHVVDSTGFQQQL